MMRVFIEREGVIVEVDRESSAFSFLNDGRERLFVLLGLKKRIAKERGEFASLAKRWKKKKKKTERKTKKREKEVRELLCSVRVFVDACIL